MDDRPQAEPGSRAVDEEWGLRTVREYYSPPRRRGLPPLALPTPAALVGVWAAAARTTAQATAGAAATAGTGTGKLVAALAVWLACPEPLAWLLLGSAVRPAHSVPVALRGPLRPLRALRRPLAACAGVRCVAPILAPSVWRGLRYWGRLLPVTLGFVRTAVRARGKGRSERDRLWEARHETASEDLYEMLVTLRGFYLKLGQLLATKTDMLPPAYTASLSRLLDAMPAMSHRALTRTIRRELGADASAALLEGLDPSPLASATIAQVHRATLAAEGDVVVKVQHPNAERMMRSDLRNMMLLSRMLSLAKLDVGFDHASIIGEYEAQVPLEFDFVREAANMDEIRGALATHDGPGRNVLVPRVHRGASSRGVLTMDYVAGVPLLDCALLSPDLRRELMTQIVDAFGVMILRTGMFHSDPHPGNLMALADAAFPGGVRPALLDFGQVKRLDVRGRAKYARLVLAMASRDDAAVARELRAAGVTLTGSSPGFVATAGYICFDTRMDFKEAFMSPLHPEAHDFRTTRMPDLAQDLFMILRAITLLRGVLASLRVDVSSALLWRGYAEEALFVATALVDLGNVAGELCESAEREGREHSEKAC